MDRNTKALKHDEPIGIIISSGSRAEAEPRFSAYVWGPVPDATEMELLLAGAGSGSHRAA